jgi:AraC-like DNA-binding protein
MPKIIENTPKDKTGLSIVDVKGKRFYPLVPEVSSIGHISALPESKNSLYRRTELEFCFRLSSEKEDFAYDEIEDKKYKTTFPHLLVKYPGVLHRYQIFSPRTAQFIIYPAEVAKVFELANMELKQFAFPFEMTASIKASLDELLLCESQVHELGAADRIDQIAVRLISEVLMQNRPSEQVLPNHNKMRQIAAYIDEHINENIDCASLAKMWGISLRSLFRHWKEVYNDTPSQYLQKRRMEFARNLLLRTDMDIAQTAESAGFSSLGYFIQAYKRYYGVTPAMFRRKTKQQHLLINE